MYKLSESPLHTPDSPKSDVFYICVSYAGEKEWANHMPSWIPVWSSLILMSPHSPCVCCNSKKFMIHEGKLIFTINMSSTDEFCKLTVISGDFLNDHVRKKNVSGSRDAVLNPISVIPAPWFVYWCIFFHSSASLSLRRRITGPLENHFSTAYVVEESLVLRFFSFSFWDQYFFVQVV